MVCWWRRGRGHLRANPRIISGPAGPGDTAGLLPGTDKEYLGRSPAERGQGIGIIQRNEDGSSHWEPLPWRIHWRQGGLGHMAGREGAGMGIVGKDTVGSLPQAPAVRLCRSAEVTPTGVVICAAGHTWHRGRLRTSGIGSEGSIYSGPLPWPRIGNTGEGVHPPAHKIDGPGPPKPNKDGPWELDRVLWYHRKTCHSAQGKGGVQYGWPLSLPTRGEGGGAEAERPADRGGPGGDPSECPCPMYTPLAEVN